MSAAKSKSASSSSEDTLERSAEQLEKNQAALEQMLARIRDPNAVNDASLTTLRMYARFVGYEIDDDWTKGELKDRISFWKFSGKSVDDYGKAATGGVHQGVGGELVTELMSDATISEMRTDISDVAEDEFESDDAGDYTDSSDDLDEFAHLRTASGIVLCSDWPRIPDTAQFLSFWDDPNSLDGNVRADISNAAVAVLFRECQSTKQWVTSLSPIVVDFCGGKQFRTFQLRAFIREIGHRNIEAMEFADKNNASLETMTKLQIGYLKMSRQSLRGFRKMSQLRSFRIGTVKYDSNVQLEDIVHSFVTWQSIRELELWNNFVGENMLLYDGRPVAIRYDPQPRTKLWTEALLYAAQFTLQLFTVAFDGKEFASGEYPSLRALSLSPLQYFQFWLRDDNIDTMKDVLSEMRGCKDLYTIRVDFARNYRWRECHGTSAIVNQCTELLSETSDERYAEALAKHRLLEANDERRKRDLLRLAIDVNPVGDLIGTHCLLARKLYGYGNLLLNGWDLDAFHMFLEPSFWTTHETALCNLIFGDSTGVLDYAAFDGNGNPKLQVLEGWHSEIQKLHGTVVKGLVQVNLDDGEFLIKNGRDGVKHTDETAHEFTRDAMVELIRNQGGDYKAAEKELDAAPRKEMGIMPEVEKKVRAGLWMEYLPADFVPKMRCVAEIWGLSKSELQRLCKALCIKPYGSRHELTHRVCNLRPAHRVPSLYNADMEMDDEMDDE